jgi:hypothetical protein
MFGGWLESAHYLHWRENSSSTKEKHDKRHQMPMSDTVQLLLNGSCNFRVLISLIKKEHVKLVVLSR